MDDAAGVGYAEGLGNLRAVAEGLLKGEAAALEAGGHGFTVEQLHYEEVGADIVEGADVGVGDGGDGAGLLLEAVKESALADFDGHGAVEAGIGGAIDLAHAAAAEQRFDPVGAELGSGFDFRFRVAGDEAGGILIEELVTACGVVCEEAFHFPANYGIGAGQSFRAAFAGGVVEVFDLLPCSDFKHSLNRSL